MKLLPKIVLEEDICVHGFMMLWDLSHFMMKTVLLIFKVI